MAHQESEDKPAPMRARAEALLARYGGPNGPTGHAAVNESGEPQSLSAFIGGKANAPRLGKLTGDGRTSSFDESQTEYQRLPGLTKPGSMACFMEQRQKELFPELTNDNDHKSKQETQHEEPSQPSDKAVSPGNEPAPTSITDTSLEAGNSATHGHARNREAQSDTKNQHDTALKETERATDNASGTAHATPSLPKRSTSGKRIVVLISGSGSNLQAIIDATCGTSPEIPDAQIVRVISNRMKAYGLQRAKNVDPPIPTCVHSLKTYQTRNPGKTREDYDLLLAEHVLGDDECAPDLVVLAGFMHIVSETFLSAMGHMTSLRSPPTFEKRPKRPVPIINLHPALPGAFDGANAIERAYEAFQHGRIQYTGAMVHEVVAEVDRGQPIVVHQVPIYKDDSLDVLESRMHSIEHDIIVQGAAKVLSGEHKVTAQAVPPEQQQHPSPPPVSLQPKSKSQANPCIDKMAVESAPGSSELQKLAATTFLRLCAHGVWRPIAQPLTLYETDVVWVNGGAASSYIWLGRSAPPNWEAMLSKESHMQLGTQPSKEQQGCESLTFMRAIGGMLVTMQGSPDEASLKEARKDTLFIVRQDDEENGVFVDQVPFEASSLCSAFSAVASTSHGVWVWHGIGSDDAQQQHAIAWTKSLAPTHKVVQTDEFFSLFDDSEYANGWHHRRRPGLPGPKRCVKLYSPAHTTKPVKFCLKYIRTDAVSVVDAYLEIYVIIGAKARGDRNAIEAALDHAERLAIREDVTEMKPPIHVLVLPSVVPLDLLALARDAWNQHVLTDDEVDDHSPVLMNLHTLCEARRQLSTSKLSLSACSPTSTSTVPANQNYLPVGSQASRT